MYICHVYIIIYLSSITFFLSTSCQSSLTKTRVVLFGEAELLCLCQRCHSVGPRHHVCLLLGGCCCHLCSAAALSSCPVTSPPPPISPPAATPSQSASHWLVAAGGVLTLVLECKMGHPDPTPTSPLAMNKCAAFLQCSGSCSRQVN